MILSRSALTIALLLVSSFSSIAQSERTSLRKSAQSYSSSMSTQIIDAVAVTMEDINGMQFHNADDSPVAPTSEPVWQGDHYC